MLDPVELLLQEHRIIDRILDRFEIFIDLVDAGRDVETRRLAAFTAFFDTFVSEVHHQKEERAIFERLIERQVAIAAKPLQRLLEEHRAFRGELDDLAELGAQPRWSIADRERVADLGFTVIENHRDHMKLEDNVLYPLARRRINPIELAEGYELTLRAQAAKRATHTAEELSSIVRHLHRALY